LFRLLKYNPEAPYEYPSCAVNLNKDEVWNKTLSLCA
jgi:hypothetical protein